jgi:hypothetical protein
MRVDLSHRLARRIDLALSDARLGMGDLPLQVGQVDRIVVDQGDAADPRTGQVERCGRTQTAGAENEGAARADALLAFDADFVEQDVP